MEFIKKNKFLIVLIALGFICYLFSFGHLGNILVDFGREMYTSSMVLDGKVLYKDIFCIYGPYGYLFNALIYKIFGESLYPLYFIGGVSSLLIIFFTYKLAKTFLSEFYSCVITFFVITTGCLATRLFNFSIPYSYGVLYGLICFLTSVYLLTKHIETKKIKPLILASLFAGFAVSCKYDFILYFIPLLFIILRTKNIRQIICSISAFLGAAALPFIILFAQGLRIQDLVNSFNLIKNFANTEALQAFYVTQGVYYTNRVWGEWLLELIILFIYSIIIYFGIVLIGKKNKFLKVTGVLAILFGIHLAFMNTAADSYLFLTFLTVVLFVLTFKKQKFIENVFILSVILISLKTLWALSYGNYGLYFLPCILISFFIISKNVFSVNLNKTFACLLIGIALGCAYYNITSRLDLNQKIETTKGPLYTSSYMAGPFNEALNYINSQKEPKSFILVPEGLSINFLTDKKKTPDVIYTSLIPLYTEGFGENNIIKDYEKNPPDYIIFSNMEAKSYGKGTICKTYAYDFCKYVISNYVPVKKTSEENEHIFVIFEKRSK